MAGRPEWDVYFLLMAQVAASRSTCLRHEKKIYIPFRPVRHFQCLPNVDNKKNYLSDISTAVKAAECALRKIPSTNNYIIYIHAIIFCTENY